MNPTRKSFLRDVMQMAWGLYRAELSGPTPRTFANALSGAWGWFKARAARAASNAAFLARHAGGVAYGSMLQSPIRRSLSGPYRGAQLRAAGYTTSSVGR